MPSPIRWDRKEIIGKEKNQERESCSDALDGGSCSTSRFAGHYRHDGGLCLDQKGEQKQSMGTIGWKPIKWNRPASLPLSKTVRSEGEIGVAERSHLMLDERGPSKKARLGWGQGLAKYEKQKVEGCADVSHRDFSPKVSALRGSLSPATPNSVTCSSSPAGTDEKLSIKGLNSETDQALCSDSLGLGPHNSEEDIFIKLDQLDANSISTLSLLLSDLMQPEDACSGDSSFTKSSTINKLLLLKKDISKELEKTECEIDLFENRLKSISCDGLKYDFQECIDMTQKLGVVQQSAKSVDASKSLLGLSTSGNCELASSVILEGKDTIHIHISEEHATDVNGTSHDSSGAVLCDEFQLIRMKTENPHSCNLLGDRSPVNIKNVKPQFPDAKPLMQPTVLLQDSLCSHEENYCLDYRNEKANDNLVAFIMASNRDAAKKAAEEFDLAMPSGLPQFNISELDFLQCKMNYMHVRERLATNKCALKFKERVLALKFKVLHHLWKEDLNLLTIRKHRPKSSKRYEVNSRSSHTALHKHRPSIRSRFALPGNLTLVPTTEILNFTSKLLLVSQMRLYRDNLKMPAQIIDENDRRYSRFYSNNGLIENPPDLEKERVMVNPWMQEEKQAFLEMLSTYGKDFQKISSFLSHKTTADCIEFYYKNHKSANFTEVKKQLKWRKQLHSRHSNTYLLTSGTRFKRETNAASLELLGTASVIAAESNCNKRSSLKQSGKSGYHDTRVYRRSNGSLEKAISEISGTEREVAAVDVLAGICGALSSDAMSSCVTSSIDPQEKFHFAAVDCSFTPEAAHTIDEEETCSDDSSDELESTDWTDEEKSMLIRALNMHGKDFIKVAHFVRTRSRDQCKTFFSKARKCLGLDVIQPGYTNGVTPLSDVNGGRSDTDDACAAEIDSAICSTQSCSRLDVDFTQSMLETCSEGHAHGGNAAQQADPDRSCERCEIGGSIPDEVASKFDDKASVINEDELVIEGAKLEFGKDQGEICSSGLRSNEPELVHVAAELFVEADTNNENTDEMLSSMMPATKLPTSAEAVWNACCGSSVADTEVDSNQFVGLPDPAAENGTHVKIKASANVGNSFTFGTGPNSHSNSNSCDDEKQKNDECSRVLFSCNFQHQVPSELLCSLQKRPQGKIVRPESAVSSKLKCVLPESSSISFNEADKELSISILKLQDEDKSRQESVGSDFSQNVLKTPFPNQIDPLHVIQGSSIQSLTRNPEEMIDRKMIVENSAIEISSMANTSSQSNCFLVPGLNNVKCVGTGILDPGPGIALVSGPKNKSERNLVEVKSDSHWPTYSQCDPSVEPEDQSLRGGDLKLFGQILTHQSSQKSSSSSQEVSIILPSPRRNSNATANSSSCWKDAAIFPPRPGRNGLIHHQGELPQRSYGFWDGNRVQTGLSSLPEPAVILANYQGPLTGMPFSISKESVASGSADYQQEAPTQSLSSEKFLETYPELPRKNGFDLLSGFQQQARMMHLGIVGVGGSGVSDPVAALQIHYSGGRRAKILTGDLDSLMGDTGGR